jgi:hypothetical protein
MPCSWCDCSSPSSFLLRHGAPEDVFTDTMMRCLRSGPTMFWWSATAEASSSLM